jgi:DNA-directed RNA polymerase subunit F
VDFSVASGGVVCKRHHDDTVMLLSPQTVRTIKSVYTSGGSPIRQDSLEEIESVLTDYMYVHLGNLNLNSLKHLK